MQESLWIFCYVPSLMIFLPLSLIDFLLSNTMMILYFFGPYATIYTIIKHGLHRTSKDACRRKEASDVRTYAAGRWQHPLSRSARDCKAVSFTVKIIDGTLLPRCNLNTYWALQRGCSTLAHWLLGIKVPDLTPTKLVKLAETRSKCFTMHDNGKQESI